MGLLKKKITSTNTSRGWSFNFHRTVETLCHVCVRETLKTHLAVLHIFKTDLRQQGVSSFYNKTF